MQERFMRRAIELAQKGVGLTSPNPAVGAVLVKKGEIIGEGWHRRAGSRHAEVAAIAQAKKYGSIKGTTLYVTLEPCCHYGKTPPCTDLILSSGIKKIVVGMVDSFWRVNRQGIAHLKEHGVDVELLKEDTDLYTDIRNLNQAFIKWAQIGLPYVQMKAAVTLDGKIATRSGESKWITGASARAHARRERSLADAVLVGAGTVEADDPELAAHGKYAKKNLLRVVIDPTLSLDFKKKVFRDEHVFVACTDKASTKQQKRFRRAGVVFASFGQKRVSFKKLFQYLGKRYITHVFVEGGGTIHGFLYDEALRDRMVLDKVSFYIAPKIIGGKKAVSAVGGRGAKMLASCIALSDIRMELIGEDMHVSGDINRY
jgi:diaminohydroxyphosphoribosylaminopyrimidine deaminase/5-amino-6-(5-phosphoribosylamino)uracil reductase